MTILTAGGSFAKSYTSQFDANVCSIRNLDKEVFLQELSSTDTIIHNAATINSTDAESFIEKNFDFSRFIIKHLEKNNYDAHFILLSSMSILNQRDDTIYGDVLQMNPYAYSKYLSETYSLRSSLKKVSCVRFSTLFYMDPAKDGLSKLIYDAVTNKKVTVYNNGIARRNFIPIDIAASYVEKISSLDSATKSTYNVCAPSSISFGDIVQIMNEYIPDLEIENKFADNVPEVLFDFSPKGIDQLGQIRFRLEDSIAHYIERLSK